jgi:hypothetical protein
VDWTISIALFAAFLYLNVKAITWVENRFNRSFRLSRGAKFYGSLFLASIVGMSLALILVPPSNGPYSYLAAGIAAGVANLVALALLGHRVSEPSRDDA